MGHLFTETVVLSTSYLCQQRGLLHLNLVILLYSETFIDKKPYTHFLKKEINYDSPLVENERHMRLLKQH